MIARAFLAAFAKEDGRAFRGFTPETEAALMAYHWPGNVRQLQNVVRSVVVLNDGEFVTPDLLPREILASAGLNLPMARLPIAPPPLPAYVTQVVEPPTPPAPAMFTQAEPPAFVQPPSFSWSAP